MIAGTLLFLAGSYLPGAAADMYQFIVFRAIQGLGAGIGIALVQTVVGDIFPPAQRAKWQGLFGIVYGVSNLIGPTVGGWLTDNGPLLGNTKWSFHAPVVKNRLNQSYDFLVLCDFRMVCKWSVQFLNSQLVFVFNCEQD